LWLLRFIVIASLGLTLITLSLAWALLVVTLVIVALVGPIGVVVIVVGHL
jgi:hypothetical protein